VLSRRREGRLLRKGPKVLRRSQGLLHVSSEERRKGLGFARDGKNVLLCDKDNGQSRRPTGRLLHSQTRLLRREVGVLFGRCETRLLSIGTEVLCR
jgi:hypothetical protein